MKSFYSLSKIYIAIILPSDWSINPEQTLTGTCSSIQNHDSPLGLYIGLMLTICNCQLRPGPLLTLSHLFVRSTIQLGIRAQSCSPSTRTFDSRISEDSSASTNQFFFPSSSLQLLRLRVPRRQLDSYPRTGRSSKPKIKNREQQLRTCLLPSKIP